MIKGTALLLSTVVLLGSALSGCMGDAIKANQQELQRQQAELDQLKQQIAAIQSQRPSYSTVAAPPGSCDANVMREAARKGGERLAAGDFAHAIGYYQDAVTACPSSARAQLNLARTYEAIGDHTEAIEHYRLAANASGTDADADSIRQAREALTRLGG